MFRCCFPAQKPQSQAPPNRHPSPSLRTRSSSSPTVITPLKPTGVGPKSLQLHRASIPWQTCCAGDYTISISAPLQHWKERTARTYSGGQQILILDLSPQNRAASKISVEVTPISSIQLIAPTQPPRQLRTTVRDSHSIAAVGRLATFSQPRRPCHPTQPTSPPHRSRQTALRPASHPLRRPTPAEQLPSCMAASPTTNSEALPALLGGRLGVDAIQEFSFLTQAIIPRIRQTAPAASSTHHRSAPTIHEALQILPTGALDARTFFCLGNDSAFTRTNLWRNDWRAYLQDKLLRRDYEELGNPRGYIQRLYTTVRPWRPVGRTCCSLYALSHTGQGRSCAQASLYVLPLFQTID